MLVSLAVIAGEARQMATASCWPLSDDQVGAALDELTAVKARLAAAELALVGEADRRGLGRADGRRRPRGG